MAGIFVKLKVQTLFKPALNNGTYIELIRINDKNVLPYSVIAVCLPVLFII